MGCVRRYRGRAQHLGGRYRSARRKLQPAVRSFTLAAGETQQDYWFVTGRRFGAQKYFLRGIGRSGHSVRGLGAACQNVEVVFAPFDLASGTPTGYIADDGTGVDPAAAVVPLASKGGGVLESDLRRRPRWLISATTSIASYMYRITNEQGETDL